MRTETENKIKALSQDKRRELLNYLQNFVQDERKQLIEEKLAQRINNIALFLEDIYQGHNASAILRSADAFAVQNIFIAENRNDFQPNSGVSLGADKWLSLHKFKSSKKAIDTIKSYGYKIYATSSNKDAMLLDELEFNENTKIAFAFGTEKSGLSDYVFEQADGLLKIPMYGFVESFNVSVAAAITLYESSKKLRTQNIGKMSPEEIELTRLIWTAKSIKNADEIINSFLKENLC